MKKIFKRGMSGLLAVLMAFTVLAGFGTTTAFAASETAESYMISFPRDGDAAQIYSADAWGHSAKNYMNGWATGSSNYTTLHCMDSFDGKVCYCIEPGLSRNVGDTYHGFGEDFWDNYPSQYNNTIEPDDIKLLLGRIMQYGYQGNLSTSWRSQNDSDADKLAHAFATQLLVWETVVGERDADFDHVSTGGYDEILSLVSPNHPLYSRIMDYYDSIESSVQSHAVCPSFMSRSSGSAKTIELAWDGSQYVAELADTNRVLSQFTFSASETDFHFSVSGNTLTITTDTAPSGNVTISASRSASRCGVLVWTDYKYGPNGGVQDTITYTASVSDPVRAFLKLKVSYGGAKIIKTSEDGKVDGITFTITGEGVNQSVTTDRNGEIHIDNLMPGIYTVTEQSYDKYVPQESHRVTVLAGQTATVSFNNVLRRGDLTVTKTSEDGLNQGVKFHLSGTSLSGLPVDEFAVTDENGVATFRDVLIGTGYTLEEMDTAIRYVIPNSQSAAVEWNSVTNKSFSNILKKFNVTVTKSDCEVGTAQGDASLAGAAYGIYKGDQPVDTYYTDENGQFTTGYYVCGDDWTIREISPSEGYLLDSTVYPVGAEAANYTVELNAAPAVAVTEQVQKGNIAIIKHSDNGDTQIETPEEGAIFAIYLKSAGSYEAAKDTERDYLTCDENGFAQSKDLPYGVYTVHQVSGWEGRELMSDFDVFIAKDGETYRYLINNANFESFIKVIKVDAETGNTIPYAGAGFQIFRPDGSKVEMTFTYPEVTTIDTFYTNDDGMLITPEKLEFGKGYSLKEVSAPYGYVLSHEAVKFDVTEENSTEESGVTVVAVKLGNYAQKGIIKISKTGEVFASVTAADGVYQPVYTVQGLAGATYEIKAAADIYTPDGTLRCSAGEVVDTVTTGADDTVESKPLYLGKYEITEMKAPDGMVVNNVQTKLAALHHLDCPWRPSDLQQREGRIIRQGNENKEVDIYTYVTENTFDSYLYQLVESKQKFIGQIMTSKSPVRSAEDIDETALSYAEIKALCAGNPHIKEKMDLDIDVSRLKLLKANHLSQRYALEDQILKEFPQKIKSLEQRIEGYRADIDQRKRNTEPNEDGFSPMFMPGGTVREKKAAGDAILGLCKSMTSPNPIPIGQYRGFDMELSFDTFSREYKITLIHQLRHTVTLGTDIFGNIQRLDNTLGAFEERMAACAEQLENTRVQLENAKAEVQTPFPQEEELAAKTARLNELNALLNLDKKENEIVDGERGEEEPQKSSAGRER